MSTINDRIAQCIATIGITKTAFARKINLSQPHMSKIALGRSAPTDRTIADICREFNVNETWLKTGKEEMFNEPPETLADRLAKEYGLDELGRQIMSAYLNLDETDRLAVGRLIQNILSEQTAHTPDDAGQERTQSDVAAELAELKRQNQELAARMAAMEEEDALLGLTDVSSKSPSVSVGNFSTTQKVKK